MTPPAYQYLFGPVPSRRLGRSLGVDIVPFKTCTQNCIYCQLGKDAEPTIERAEYVPVEAVLEELRRKAADGLDTDVVTLSGSGEPTLHSGLGRLIDGIHQIVDVPVVVITNGTLLSDPAVRTDCAKADIVMPSLDAGDAATFEAMNHPHPDLDFETFVDGLCRFRQEFGGTYWLEVFFCEGLNTDPDSVERIKTLIERIGPDKVQLNTAVRPVAHTEARQVSPESMDRIARQLGQTVEVISPYAQPTPAPGYAAARSDILDMLRRRPCSLEDICSGRNLNRNVALKLVQQLLNEDAITAEPQSGTVYYKTR